MNGPSPENDIYDFAPESSPPPPPRRSTVAPVASAGSPPVLSYRAAGKDEPLPTDPDTIKNIHLPLGILAGGVLIEIVCSIIWTHQLLASLAELAVDLTLGTAVMLGAMLIAARLRGIDLGSLGVAAYKLAAVSVGPAAVVEFIEPIARFLPFGWILCLIVEFILFFALLGALFDLDESDTWFCVWTMLITRVVFYFLLQAVFRG
jgi:hypothetical protein